MKGPTSSPGEESDGKEKDYLLSAHPFLRWPRWSLFFFVLAALALLFGWGRSLPFATDPAGLLQENPLHVSTLERVQSVSPVGDILVINVETDELFSDPVLALLEDLGNELLRALPVRSIKSLTHAVMPVREGFRLRFEPLLPPEPRDEAVLARFREFTTTHPLMRNVLVSADGRHTLLTLELSEMPAPDEMRETVDRIIKKVTQSHDSSVRIDYLTLPLALVEMVELARNDSLRLSVLGFLLVLGFLFAVFRSFRVVGFLLLSLLLYGLVLALLLPWLVEEFSPYNLALLPILWAIQLALLVHLAWGTVQERKALPEGSPKDLAGSVMRRLWRPCLFASLTSAGALLSFLLAPMEEIRQVGLVGSLSVLIGWVLAFGPGAALLVWLFPVREISPAKGEGLLPGTNRNLPCGEVDRESGARLDSIRLGRLANRWYSCYKNCWQRVGLLAGSLLLLLLGALPGLWFLRADIHLSRFLDPGTATGRMLSLMEEKYGGYTLFEIGVDSGAERGVNDLEFLLWLEARVEALEKLEGVSAVYSYPQVLGLLHEIWQGGEESWRKVPTNRMVRGIFTTALQTQRQFAMFDLLVDPDWRVTRVFVRSRDQTATGYLSLLQKVEKVMADNSPESVGVSLDSGRRQILEAERRITGTLMRSLGVSLLCIVAVLLVLWRRLWPSLVAVGTVAFPLIVLFGAMGFFGIPLNISTVLAATLILGVAIDDVVHLLTSRERTIRRGKRPREALWDAWLRKGPAILTTTGVLVIIFLTLPLSRFPPVRDLGWLLALGFLFVLATIWVLPILTSPRQKQ